MHAYNHLLTPYSRAWLRLVLMRRRRREHLDITSWQSSDSLLRIRHCNSFGRPLNISANRPRHAPTLSYFLLFNHSRHLKRSLNIWCPLTDITDTIVQLRPCRFTHNVAKLNLSIGLSLGLFHSAKSLNRFCNYSLHDIQLKKDPTHSLTSQFLLMKLVYSIKIICKI